MDMGKRYQRIRLDQLSFVMAGHSRLKDGVASACLCPGHPRLLCNGTSKTWMPGTRPGMTVIPQKKSPGR
jgi:hypothetical protein